MAKVFIGTSGWVYPHWKGVFYPEDMKQKDWFMHYASYFDTVEINNSFYRLPELKTFENWARNSPANFRFTVKANRFITHVKRLKDPKESVSRFFDNLEGMGEKCSVVLFQLPPKWKADVERLESFLSVLPEKTRFVFEFRDETWLCEPVYELLRKNGAALCFADRPFCPGPREVTADFCFYRMHGGYGREAPGYSTRELKNIATEIALHLEAGRDAFAYFNNDYEGFAVKNALDLKSLIGKENQNARTSGRRSKKKAHSRNIT
ncbi:MAG: DUF72 domain-containing protein [Actinomycetota bacterium]|nr:DUF72 domain-containing protein [Actinomycetota bacterium]